MTISSNENSASLRAQIQQCLVESGNYEAISNELTERLLKDGWVDEVKKLAREEISQEDSPNFSKALSQIEPQALDLVQQSTKDAIMRKITAFLEEIVETE
ncbi:Transcription and mRNA export factor SUS1 [Nakaseomyces glabratus]|uniref:Transcription and mRNA export factor SUS1 n=1 Tax=Candida glabrata TaxID=5478 RepID=A0A0W0EJA9_CANGB|nr:SAGA histone acetylase and TREX-2 complexes component [Nakaseomyces glabratus]KTB02607.1 Transcription and mRNA export factor SUS1 [Nakaseomyces glabratus]KTB07913.1 Transcription and mRNA export factor SUS1 [Nakaseomyces glabratus]KTB09947.1 Transcription and mRNA export factor SUS1 [Nakaseomyces glabratus]KTB21208.1 Transcription and mRNA export factor SUS1 [Nakaseomyces glabratus]